MNKIYIKNWDTTPFRKLQIGQVFEYTCYRHSKKSLKVLPYGSWESNIFLTFAKILRSAIFISWLALKFSQWLEYGS